MNSEALWFLSRATGTVTLVLLTVVGVLGIVTSGRRRPHGESATIVMAMHRWLSVGMLAFLSAHIVTAIVDTYVSIPIAAVVLPFVGTYRTFWVGLGTLAFDLVVAVVATSLLRHRIPERAWRLVHWAAYAMWPIAVVHGFMLGTSDQWVMRATTVACGVILLAAAIWRFSGDHADGFRRRVVAEGEWR